jgi:hypothetical protein
LQIKAREISVSASKVNFWLDQIHEERRDTIAIDVSHFVTIRSPGATTAVLMVLVETTGVIPDNLHILNMRLRYTRQFGRGPHDFQGNRVLGANPSAKMDNKSMMNTTLLLRLLYATLIPCFRFSNTSIRASYSRTDMQRLPNVLRQLCCFFFANYVVDHTWLWKRNGRVARVFVDVELGYKFQPRLCTSQE